MKIAFRLFTVVALAGLWTSCEKVIDVDLDEADDPVLVIEANLVEGPQNFQVSVTKTTSYFDASAPITVDNANIVLSDDQGNTYPLASLGNGLYAVQIDAQTERTYTLTANIDGQEYTASSYLPASIPLQELVTEFSEANAFNDEGYQLFLRWQDIEFETNYYRVRHSVNGDLQNDGDDLQVLDDRLFDGGLTRLPVFGKVFGSGETVEVELIHLDIAGYEYFNSLSDILSSGGGPGGGNAAPGNPNTNWSGDILGYFSASNSSTLTIVMP